MGEPQGARSAEARGVHPQVLILSGPSSNEASAGALLLNRGAVVEGGGGGTHGISRSSPRVLNGGSSPPISGSGGIRGVRRDTAVGRSSMLQSTTLPSDLDILLPLLTPEGGGTARAPDRGVAAAAAQLAKTALGVGMVAVPFAFSVLGAVPGTALLALSAFLTWYSCSCLAAGAAATGRLTFAGVLVASLGRWAGIALDLCMAANCWLVQVVILVICGDLLGSAELAEDLDLPDWLQQALTNRALVIGCLALVVLVPLLSVRRMGRASAAISALGLTAVMLWSGASAAVAVYAAGWRGTAHAIPLWPRWELLPGGDGGWRRVMSAVGLAPVVITAFVCQPPFFQIASDSLRPQPPSTRAMRRAAGGAVLACLALFLALALSSIAAFGSDLEQNLLLAFTYAGLQAALGSKQLAAALAAAVRIAYLASVVTSFPLVMAPLRDSIHWLVHAHHSYSNLAAPELNKRFFYSSTYGSLATAYTVAVFAPSVWIPLQLIGSTAVAAVCFFLPGLLRCSVERWRPTLGALGGATLFALGIVQSVAGMTSAVLALQDG